MSDRRRIVLQEMIGRPETTVEVAQASAVSIAEVGLQLRDLNDRLRAQFGFKSDPLEATSDGTWRVEGVAGLMRLNQYVEIEVVPKFLDADSPTWRVDFFVLAVLVQTGHLLTADEISAEADDRVALATLVARSLLRMHDQNSRRTIRGYRRRSSWDFSLDGDVDWETLALPGPDGMTLQRLELTARNAYNATLLSALETLMPEVTDTDTQAQLQALTRAIKPQDRVPRVFPALPQRHSSWTTAYELSQMVVNGLGLDPASGRFSGPGFVLSTWLAWQQLFEEVARRANPGRRVVPQAKLKLGERASGTVDVVVTPDIAIEFEGAKGILLDAKYKTRIGRRPRIDSADLYESLAFLRAAGYERIGLLYPSGRSVTDLPTGEWRRFDRVMVDIHSVEGIEVQLQGLGSKNGFANLVAGARAGQLALATH